MCRSHDALALVSCFLPRLRLRCVPGGRPSGCEAQGGSVWGHLGHTAGQHASPGAGGGAPGALSSPLAVGLSVLPSVRPSGGLCTCCVRRSGAEPATGHTRQASVVAGQRPSPHQSREPCR